MGSKENDIWAKNMLENNRRKLGHASENRSSPNWPFFGPFFETSKKGSNSPVLKHKTSVERGEILWPRKPVFWDLVLRPFFRRSKKWSIYHWFIVTFGSGVFNSGTAFSGPPGTLRFWPWFIHSWKWWYFDPRACRFQPVFGSRVWGGFFILPSGSTLNSWNSRNLIFELSDFYGRILLIFWRFALIFIFFTILGQIWDLPRGRQNGKRPFRVFFCPKTGVFGQIVPFWGLGVDLDPFWTLFGAFWPLFDDFWVIFAYFSQMTLQNRAVWALFWRSSKRGGFGQMSHIFTLFGHLCFKSPVSQAAVVLFKWPSQHHS